MIREIPLGGGQVAIVDDEDYDRIKQFGKWHVSVKKGIAYAACSRRVNGKVITTAMHRLLHELPTGMHTDHKNGNGLDNRRNNLRTATSGENRANSKVNKNSLSGAKGVAFCRGKATNPYRVFLYRDKKRVHVGYFPDISTAAAAYAVAAKEAHGEFARCSL